ncbi:MAG: hypothetical protein SR2Q5_02540 [Quinella sp. 2Q5]|nr:hypothetical protein [Quinella sp. 2Q5]
MERLQQIQQLRRNLDEMRGFGASLKKIFSTAETFIDAEKFMPSELLNDVGKISVDWAKVSGQTVDIYGELFEDRLPESFAAVEEILSAEEKRIREADVTFQARKFLMLVTDDADLQEILRGYQNHLRELLTANAKDELTPYVEFVKAVQEPDFGKKFSASMQFSHAFKPDFIGRGLFEGKLTFGTEEISEPPPISKFAKTLRETGAPLTAEDFAAWDKISRVQENPPPKEFSPKQFKRDFEERMFFTEIESKAGSDLAVGCFRDDIENCDDFLARLKARLDRNFDRVIVAGLTLEHADKIFDVLEKFLPPAAAQYLYAFDDDEFYRRDTREKISADEIWIVPSEEDIAARNMNAFNEIIRKLVDAVKAEILSDVRDMLLDKKFYCATAYLKAQSSKHDGIDTIYRQLAFALNDPLLDESYSSASVLSLAAPDDDAFNEALITAAAIRALFSNDFNFDRGLEDIGELVNDFEIVRTNDALANLIGDLQNFKTETNTGAEFYADSHSDEDDTKENFAQAVSNAQDYFDRWFGQKFETTHPVFSIMCENIFALNGELANVFRMMLNSDTSMDNISRVESFLEETFLKSGAPVNVDNIDTRKLDNFIDDRWAAAHRQRFPRNVVREFIRNSGLRNNIESNLRRMIRIMCTWVDCARELSKSGADWGRHKFIKIRHRLIENAQIACERLNAKLMAKTLEAAGITVLIKTLEEICWRLKGSAAEHDYFYVGFLCADFVITDEKCLPNLTLNISDGTNDGLPEQILKHARQKNLPTARQRLEYIFSKDGNFNYGAAKVLDAYLQATGSGSFIAKNVSDFRTPLKAGANEVHEQWDYFRGGVRRAKFHGQLQDMPEGTEARVLQIGRNCYEYALSSQNYGVFFRVKKFWEDEIARAADKTAERFSDKLQRAAENFRRTNEDFDPQELQESLDAVEKFIAEKMFTKAEACIDAINDGILYKKTDGIQDYTLENFLNEHDDLYQRVKDTGRHLKYLLEPLKNRHETRSKKRALLMENWMPSGKPDSETGMETLRKRVHTLLELLGFDVESLEPSGADDIYSIAYKVKLKRSYQIQHNHPIAAFGSAAQSDRGFQVACIWFIDKTSKDEDLLFRFKALDDNNTLVLLDRALLKVERRRLDKKLKHDKSLRHVFAVIDRVVMTYLVKHYSEQIRTKRINDALMSLIMPFSRCQPYVWDPKKPLPPEMFKGREDAMDKVKDPNGVNLVYGGRQLGKSALLKMARMELDGNDSQRAILVEVKDEDYLQAALKVSRELIDQKFFDATDAFAETDDWEVITRAIKNRLADDARPRVKYFLLMLDEADTFIKTCALVKNKPIQVLSDLQQNDYNGSRFKFVIAGTHNVVRFDKEQSQRDNNILPLLKHFTITPFTPQEARKLLEVPLNCLGLRLPDDDFISLIEETALYFPGLIQYFCEKLLLTLFDYRNYDEDTPPYVINKNLIKKLLADKDFVDIVKERINITLQLGDDRYYYVIALILAYLYHTLKPIVAFSPSDILQCARTEFDHLFGKNFLPDNEAKIDALMVELCELNILRKTAAGKYHFANDNICQNMGTPDDILEKLIDLE